MSYNDNDLTTKPIPQLIKELAIPASVGLLFNTFYNITDIYFAGLISTGALAGLSYAFSLFFVLFGSMMGVLLGAKALIGNSLGAKKITTARLYSHQGISFSLIMAVVLISVSVAFSRELFTLMNVTEEYMGYTLGYFNVITFSFVAVFINASLNNVLTSRGDTKSYRNTLMLGFFLNIVLNSMFGFGFLFIPPMGVQGIALSTVIIGIINMMYLWHKTKKTDLVSFARMRYFIPKVNIFKHIFVQGWPSGFNMFIMSIGGIIMVYFISGYGKEAVAGFGIGLRVEQVMLLPALGINMAVLSLVSNNYGAKQFTRIKEIVIVSLKYSYLISFVGLVVFFFTAELVALLFSSDPLVIKAASELVIVDAFTFFAYSTIFISVATLQGMKRPKMIFYVSLFRQFIFPLILYSLVAFYFELPLIFIFLSTTLSTYIAAIWIFLHTRSIYESYHTSSADK